MTPEVLRAEALSAPTTNHRPPTTDRKFHFVGRPSSVVRRQSWLKWLLIGIVAAYIAVLILAPLAALVAGAFSGGLGAIFTALNEPDVRSAFWRTLLISVVVVIIHVLCGTAVAWILVRHRFRGRGIL